MPTFQCVYCGADVPHKAKVCDFCNNHQPMHPGSDNYDTPCGVRKDFDAVYMVTPDLRILRCTDFKLRHRDDGPIKDYLEINMGYTVTATAVFWPYRASKYHRLYFSYGEACRNIEKIAQGNVEQFSKTVEHYFNTARAAHTQELGVTEIPATATSVPEPEEAKE